MGKITRQYIKPQYRISFYVFTGKYIKHKAGALYRSAFIDNLPQIFAGTFNQALLEDASGFSRLLELSIRDNGG